MLHLFQYSYRWIGTSRKGWEGGGGGGGQLIQNWSVYYACMFKHGICWV